MTQLTPHLLLRADPGASRAATLLGTAGYMVSKIVDDATMERISGAPNVEGVVIDLPVLTAIALVRRIEALHGQNVAIIVIAAAVETVRRALPSVRVIKPEEIDDDLVSTVDLALIAQPIRSTA
ncbi:MAG TPA: hypothetical protein VLC46_22120 [Thermoanaerobaculia bacterium]|jgi:hypothetical protein|nr:hypothetical protein [Thermoanaerobaculia bacterium]